MDIGLPGAPNLRSWHYFLKVAELGSLTAAANHLQVAQPALSRHIGRMEHGAPACCCSPGIAEACG